MDKLKIGSFYLMRNGMPIGPIEEWNPILRVAKLLRPISFGGQELKLLTWGVTGESTCGDEYDIVEELIPASVADKMLSDAVYLPALEAEYGRATVTGGE